MKPEKKGQHPREVEDAIAFLHSMLELVDARGWSHVTDYLAGATLGLAHAILGPETDPPTKAIEDARRAIDAASAFLEEFPHPTDRMPTPILKGAVAMIETLVKAFQAAQEEHPTEVPHPSPQEVSQ